jgi:oxygen-dependent protoporphyrinogen oxidase
MTGEHGPMISHPRRHTEPSDRVVVVGGGISGLTAAYEARKQGRKVLLLEAGSRFGGTLQSTSLELDGWGPLLLENGAESMILAKPHARELCEELGLERLTTVQRYRGTRILRHGKLRAIPVGLRLMAPGQLWPFLASDVVSPWAKLRMLAEYFIPARPGPSTTAGSKAEDEDESVASFVLRRFGQECLERLAQPLLAGIYTADPNELSLLASQPDFRQLELRSGSVLRGLWHGPLPIAGREPDTSNVGPRYGLFFSLAGGLQQLVDRLVESCGEDARLDAAVEWLQPDGEGYKLKVRGQDEPLTAARVILALPTHQSARLLESFAPDLALRLGSIRHLSAATVNLVYPLDAVGRETDAFGFVVPHVEGRDILACTYSHRKYPGRCPAGLAILRAYVGGQLRPDAMEWTDEQMIERSHRELSDILQIKGAPKLALVSRWVDAMPLYEVGHRDKVASIQRYAAAHPHLSLLGNAFQGVGISDCIGNARQAVRNLL